MIACFRHGRRAIRRADGERLARLHRLPSVPVNAPVIPLWVDGRGHAVGPGMGRTGLLHPAVTTKTAVGHVLVRRRTSD